MGQVIQLFGAQAGGAGSTVRLGEEGATTASSNPHGPRRQVVVPEVVRAALTVLHYADLSPRAHLRVEELCRLLYYCEGFALVLLERSLFDDEIVVDDSGVYIEEILSSFGEVEEEVDLGDGCVMVDDAAAEVIFDVWRAYGQYSGWRTVEFVQSDQPWLRARSTDEGSISRKEMRRYFRQLVEDQDDGEQV